MTHGVKFTFPMSKMAGDIFLLCDGLHTIDEIIRSLVSKQCDADGASSTCPSHLKENITSEVIMTLKSLSDMSKLSLTYEKLDVSLIPVGENGRKCQWSRDFG